MLVLPEMALTGRCPCADAGYLYSSYEEIEPLLESPYRGEGATYELATSLAKELECYVVAGFPERASDEALAEFPGAHDARTPRAEAETIAPSYLPSMRGKAFNSALLVDPSGALVRVFRKHFLYEADTPWADEGQGFTYVDLPIGRVCVAICMDLNRAWIC